MAKTNTFGGVAVAEDDDREAMRLQISELQAKLAAAESKPPAPSPPTGPMRFWKVELPHGPTFVVEAIDEANAFAAYRKRARVIVSEHQPVIKDHVGPCGRIMPDGTGGEKFIRDAAPIAA